MGNALEKHFSKKDKATTTNRDNRLKAICSVVEHDDQIPSYRLQHWVTVKCLTDLALTGESETFQKYLEVSITTCILNQR